jgi:hypothetical protein
MGALDTHYCCGDDIRAGDRVRSGDWTGVVVFVLGTGSFGAGYKSEDWSYLGRGFMVEYDQVGLVFAEEADEDLELVARVQSCIPQNSGQSDAHGAQP